jgi:hypothetical protein
MIFKVYDGTGGTLQEREAHMDLQDAIDAITYDLVDEDVVFRLVESELEEPINEEVSYFDSYEIDELSEDSSIEKFVALFFTEEEVDDYTDDEIIEAFANGDLTALYAIKEVEGNFDTV